jgi:predicted enzyme related to lactoylglutathione lyase
MTEFSSYAHGTPCWVDVTSHELEKTIEFYGALFGWEAEQDPRPEAGGYTMFTVRGKNVAAASPPQEEGIPAHWTTYIASDDVDDTAARIRDAGGLLHAEPFDVFDSGRMTVAQDPTGAVFGVWQAGTHHGAQLANEPGSFQWNECETRDVAAAADFYTAVFGYRVDEMDMGQEEPYRLFMLSDHRVAGLFKITPEMGDDVPPNWMTVFSVADCDAAAAKAQELGGALLHGPQDIPVGRFAVLQDSTGAVFQVVAPPSV